MAKVLGKKNAGALINLKKGVTGFLGGNIGTALTVGAGVMGYNDARSQGSGVIGATAQGVTDALIVDVLGMKTYFAYEGIKMAGAGAVALGTHGYQQAVRYHQAGTAGAFSAGTFMDTEQAYTMRQAGVTQIQQNQMNTKKAMLGTEALYLHR